MGYVATEGEERAHAKKIARQALDKGKGIVRLAQNLVPRVFCEPGKRIKLHTEFWYGLGPDRGGWDERWFASTTAAENGPLTAPNEGLSRIVFQNNDGAFETVLLKEAFEDLGTEFLGEGGRWDVYSKFFDNAGALPWHVHHRDKHAARTGQQGKPEAYYFPPQQNPHGGKSDYTFMGLKPGTTRDQVREYLKAYLRGDNRFTDISVAYRLKVGTGWDIPAGVGHAPGSMCTFEPQKASDVFTMFASVTDGIAFPSELFFKDVPDDVKVKGIDAVIDWNLDLLDMGLNTDLKFAINRFMAPKRAQGSIKEGYVENWITYKSPDFSAKELTVLPGETVEVTDSVAYSAYVAQGHGTMGDANWEIGAPIMVYPGQITDDEFFISKDAAQRGVRITNTSHTEPLVLLKTFASRNPDLEINKVIAQEPAVIYEPHRPLMGKPRDIVIP